jgi:hypothetical protein
MSFVAVEEIQPGTMPVTNTSETSSKIPSRNMPGISTKVHRSRIVVEIVKSVRAKGSDFVKQETNGEWIKVGNLLAQEKIGKMF